MCLIDELTKKPQKFRMFTGMTGAEFDQLCTGVQKKLPDASCAGWSTRGYR